MAGIFGVGTQALDVIQTAEGNFTYDDKINVEVTQRAAQDNWIRPIGGVVNQQGPHTFVLFPMADKYIQMNTVGLEIECKVVREDGTQCTIWDDIVAPINLLGPCMWEQVEVELNDQPFPGASGINVGYKAYLETLLSNDSAAKNTHLNSQFLYLDTPGQFWNMRANQTAVKAAILRATRNGLLDGPEIPEYLYPNPTAQQNAQQAVQNNRNQLAGDVEIVDYEHGNRGRIGTEEERAALTEVQKKLRRYDLFHTYFNQKVEEHTGGLVAMKGEPINQGFDDRYTLTCGSHTFDMFTPIVHDVFKMSNNLGPGNKVMIRLTPYSHDFLLNTAHPDRRYKLIITDMKLHYRTIELVDSVPFPLVEKYEMTQTEMHKSMVVQGSPNAFFRVHNGGIMPQAMIFFMVTVDAAEGNFNENPVQLHHYFIEEMKLIINGENHPVNGLEFDFYRPNSKMAFTYDRMFRHTGAAGGNRGNMVSWNAYQTGTFFVPFDLTTDLCNGFHNHNGKPGYIDVSMRFREALKKSIYVFYEKVFHKQVINDKATGNLIFNDVLV